MNDNQLIEKTAEMVKARFASDTTGHDWWHLHRVWQLARRIALQEKNVEMTVVELGALLHDIADWKFHGGDEEAGPAAARQWLKENEANEKVIRQVEYIVRHISFKGGTNRHLMQTIEGQIVQDADRLDALGAVGIARAFIYSGVIGQPLHDPGTSPKTYKTFKEFQEGLKNLTTINHFYEKLLLLKDQINTDSGKQLAEHRHKVMEAYLEEFYDEWEGRR